MKTVWKKNKWILQRDDRRKRTIWIMNDYHSSSCIVYDDGQIGYDAPELIPPYVKQAIRKIADKIMEEVSE